MKSTLFFVAILFLVYSVNAIPTNKAKKTGSKDIKNQAKHQACLGKRNGNSLYRRVFGFDLFSFCRTKDNAITAEPIQPENENAPTAEQVHTAHTPSAHAEQIHTAKELNPEERSSISPAHALLTYDTPHAYEVPGNFKSKLTFRLKHFSRGIRI
jgi:hypothetical protein